MFVLNPEPGEQPKAKPVTKRAAIDDADEAIDTTHPEERLEHIQRIEISDPEIDRGRKSGETGQCHRPGASSHLPDENAGECNCTRAGQGREESKGKE